MNIYKAVDWLLPHIGQRTKCYVPCALYFVFYTYILFYKYLFTYHPACR